MIIETKAFGFSLTPSILMHVESRVESGIGFASRSVQRVTVRLDDINATRGGVDKRCRLVVHLRHRRILNVEATHEDLYAAIDAAVHRIRRLILSESRRHLAMERRDPQRPGALALA